MTDFADICVGLVPGSWGMTFEAVNIYTTLNIRTQLKFLTEIFMLR